MKIIKDPIYGYIDIEDKYIPVIDSIYFQRLRNIIQTSYTPIYPSSLHNRFTHSLGVYHLGRLAFDSLINNSVDALKNVSRTQISKLRYVFIFACLCHDLGHSPFSHTGEKFYDKKLISDSLNKLVKNEDYTTDLKSDGGIVGKEHEIMSALLALKVFKKLIMPKYYEFFARCIIGLQYKNVKKSDATYKLKSACIELLNSDIIDVDELDYLVRDSYMSGYLSVAIDYNRLLEGISLNLSDKYPICYQKRSLSVLESVLTAHDMERRWIQAHPVVLYEAYLLQTIIREINGKYIMKNRKDSLFSLKALMIDGVDTNEFGSVKLLSDADILYLAKQSFNKSLAVQEYFSRQLRRHPIWKSEAEYMTLFNFNKNKKFIDILQHWEDILISGEYGVYSLNDDFLKMLKIKAEELADKKAVLPSPQNATLLNRINKINDELKLLIEIKDYFDKNDIPFDLVIISLKKFKSNIYKEAFKNLPISFGDYNTEPISMKEVTHISLDTTENKDFFYLYYKRKNKTIDIQEFSKMLQRAAVI